MNYNVCETCGAKDGRAGMLIEKGDGINECKNCRDTRDSGNIIIHTNLSRTGDELKKTMAILG